MCGRIKNIDYNRFQRIKAGNIGEPVRRVEFEPLPPVEIPTESPAEAPAEAPAQPVPA